jgi:uncharacterized protein
MNQIFVRLARFSVERRRAVICLLIFISTFAVVGYVNPTLFSAWLKRSDGTYPWQAAQKQVVTSTNSDDRPELTASPPRNVSPLSLSNSDVVLVVECDNFFTPRAVEALRHMVDQLESMDQVDLILWLDRVPTLNIFGLPQPILPAATASPGRFEAAKQAAIDHPLIGGRLLSDDTQTMLLLTTLNYYFVFNDADATSELGDVARAAAAEFPDVNLRIRVSGRVPSMLAAIQSHEANQLKYQIIGYGMILLMSIILFRGLRAVIIVALAPATGVFWTLGFTKFLGFNENPLIDVILPILVSLVALTDGVHLMVQIRKLRAHGETRQSAAKIGLEQVGLACFLTSLTTAIGFGSLILADSEWVQQFGICSTIGVFFSFIAVVTVIPLACSSWLGNRVHIGHGRSLVDQNLERISGLIAVVLRVKLPLAVISIASTIVLGAIALTLKPDQRVSDGLPEAAEATQALVHVDQSFGGLEFSQVDVQWNKDVASDAPEVLLVLQKVDELLKREVLIGHPLSIRNLIDAQPGSGSPAERMTLLELLPPQLKRAFYTPEYRTASVTFRVQDLGIARYGPVFTRIEQGLIEIQAAHPNFVVQLRENGAVWRWKNLYQIVVDLAASLGTASIIIFIVLAVVYRSLRLGLISIIPNLFPLALTGAYLVIAGYNLEIVMVCSFTICLGIAVDDTIHFLTRYQEERRKTDDEALAIQRAFTGVGTALIMTTVVLVSGFSIVTLSDSRDHKIFATMGALTIAAALFCDLIFLPALLALFAKGKPEMKAP